MKSTSEKYRETYKKYEFKYAKFIGLIPILLNLLAAIVYVFLYLQTNEYSLMFLFFSLISFFIAIYLIDMLVKHYEIMWLIENDIEQYLKLYGDKNDIR